jgi:hypothetical protein
MSYTRPVKSPINPPMYSLVVSENKTIRMSAIFGTTLLILRKLYIVI